MKTIKFSSLFIALALLKEPLYSKEPAIVPDGFVVSVPSPMLWDNDNLEKQTETRKKVEELLRRTLKAAFPVWRFETAATLQKSPDKTLTDELIFTVAIRSANYEITDVPINFEWRRAGSLVPGAWPPGANLLVPPQHRSI